MTPKELQGIKENVSLAEHTAFKIGGPARWFFACTDREDLKKAVKVSKEEGLSLLIFSGGTNILFPDEGFSGLVMKCMISGVKREGERIKAGAGTSLSYIVKDAKESSLEGLSWAAGIPGSLGGAVFGNAQAFDGKMSDSIEEVEALDIESIEFRKFSKKECRFSLKNSLFKKNPSLLIVSVTLLLKEGNKEKIEKKMLEHLEYRKEKQPQGSPCAGSVFVNPERGLNPDLLKEYPKFKEKGFVPAGFLIEKAGLKGKRIGKAEISEKHANFIINVGGAKAEDVKALVRLAKDKVREKFSIELEEEIRIINN